MKYKLILLLEKLEDEKNKHKILKQNCESIRRKSKAHKVISKRMDLLRKQDEKYYALCKEITGEILKEECLNEMKLKIERIRKE